MKEVEKIILRWLEARDENWYWFFGSQKLDKKATIEKFKKDKAFRKMIVEQVYKVAIEMFENHMKKEGKA